MNTLNFTKLYSIIEKKTKASYVIDLYNDKPAKSVANFGANKDTIVKLERNGEYNGIAVQLLEDLRPLLTNYTVVKILKLLEKEDYITPLILFRLKSLDELFYVLKEWFRSATTYEGTISKLFVDVKDIDNDNYLDWVKSVRSDALPCRLKIIEVGHNDLTNESVIPVEWMDKEFCSGEEVHLAMDTLDTRIGKPPVTYAIIYTMVLVKQNDVLTTITKNDYEYLWYVELVDGEIQSSLSNTVKKNKYTYVKYNTVVIGFVLDDLLEPKTENNGVKEVGLLVSRLQKSIRRGRNGRKTLEETIVSLNNSPNYNLPEQHFLRVSASKQLVWRLFITIMEDCRPYQKGNELSLLDLILLVLITQRCTEYKFNPIVLDLIKLTAILAQFNDTDRDLFDWRALEAKEKIKYGKSDYHDAIGLALNNIIMMSGDDDMLRRLYNTKREFDPFVLPKKYNDDVRVNKEIVLASMDHHCKPCIILYYQATQKIKLTTREISNLVWDVSSGFNVRYDKEQKVNVTLREIQAYLLNIPVQLKHTNNIKYNIVKGNINEYASRTAFLILFGQKYKYRANDVILAGDATSPAKVKSKNQWVLSADINVLNAYGTKNINLKQLMAPSGYGWTKDTVITSIKAGVPYIDGKEVVFFDGSSVLKPITQIIEKNMKNDMKEVLLSVFSGDEMEFEHIIHYRYHARKTITNWGFTYDDLKVINMDLMRGVYVKILNQVNNIIMIGPVDRSGNKMANSISYLLEGKYWLVFNMFCYLYPDTFQPHGLTNFTVKTNTVGYNHALNMLKIVLFQKKEVVVKLPKITTTLWSHQMESAQKIIHGFDIEGAHGKGDASDVGAGKSLVGLTVAVELINKTIINNMGDNKGVNNMSSNNKGVNNNIHGKEKGVNNNIDGKEKEKINIIYYGILVLVPGNALINTWKEEIAKHTSTFDVQYHDNKNKITIGMNTIVISTMGKMRDHPIHHNWLLVIIDECLTTQNRNALWTQEAWKQGLMSKHLLMLSATFFRAKFLGLYYMLQMLQTNLPEKKEYLDTILSEAIVSNMSKDKRKWITNINYLTLNDKQRVKYEAIEGLDLSIEKKYAQLYSYLTNNKVQVEICKQISAVIDKLSNNKCLIYARSKEEADIWSDALSIGIYPKKGKHVIITVTNGTYGLNDLVEYNTIIMIPPAPDKIPQMKGRLDRPGQKATTLHMEYIVVKDTIEEGLLLRIDICNNFVNQYIMPMSKFYELAINKNF